jgi:hypothetical protein
MIREQFLVVLLGTVLIRTLHLARRRLSRAAHYFSFSDFLVEARQVRSRGFIMMAVPPLLGGVAISLIPGVEPLTVGISGFLAAFLGVWPVLQFPDQLLDEYLLPYWSKLRLLYVLFLGFSTAVSYGGAKLVHIARALAPKVAATSAWTKFLDDLAANAIYDILKGVLFLVLIASGLYVHLERMRIGLEVDQKKRDDWEERMKS